MFPGPGYHELCLGIYETNAIVQGSVGVADVDVKKDATWKGAAAGEEEKVEPCYSSGMAIKSQSILLRY